MLVLNAKWLLAFASSDAAAALFMSPRGNESNTIAEIIPFIAVVQSLPELFRWTMRR
jgi:hypothetical protein